MTNDYTLQYPYDESLRPFLGTRAWRLNEAMDLTRTIVAAEQRIRPYVRETPFEQSIAFSRVSGARVFFKLENLQHTGSFKVRGAANKIVSLDDDTRQRGLVAASTGNHGAAVAFTLGKLGLPGVVFVPEEASAAKVESIRVAGAEVRVHGQDPLDTEKHARHWAAEQRMTYVSPYNDVQVVAGQGTIGLEMDRQLDEPLDAVFVAVGGGGLIAGVAAALRISQPDVRIIACSPQNSAVLAESIRAGRIMDLASTSTLSDATAGGLETGAITFELCRELVDEHICVTESEIAAAMRRFIGTQHMLIEGAAGVAIAGFERACQRFAGANVAVIICGANLSLDALRSVLEMR